MVLLGLVLVLVSHAEGGQDCRWHSSLRFTNFSDSFFSNFDFKFNAFDCVLEPFLFVQEKTAIPHSQGWSHCRYCGFKKGIKSSSFSGPEAVDLSWSQHSESFGTRIDYLRSDVLTNPKISVESIMISTPIFIVPMLCYQVGHLLIDFMEQVYSTMIEMYGLVRLDAVLVVSVAETSQNTELQKILNRFVNSLDQASFGYMIHWLTNRLVFAYDEFFSKITTIPGKMIIFSDIYFGGDISSTFMHLGTPHNPCRFQLKDSSLESISQNYQRFHKFISDSVNELIKDTDPFFTQPIIDVLFIYRNSSRNIVNMKEMIDIVSAMNLRWLAVDFAVTPFSTQLIYLRKTRLLVAAAGTAMHNMIFMNRSTSAIVIMMKDWCHCSWQYVNQGILLGINVLTYCQPNEGDNQMILSHWTSKFWLQCSIITKHSEVAVNLTRFSSDLGQLFLHSSNFGGNLWCDMGSTTSSEFRRLAIFSFAEVNSTFTNSQWIIELVAEVEAPILPQQMLKSFPQLTLCLLLYFSSGLNAANANPLCLTTDGFHSYSFFLIEVRHPSLTLHSWAQLTPQGGKVRGSDRYLSLDLRVKNSLSRALPQILLNVGNCLKDGNSAEISNLVCFVDEIEIPLCVKKPSPNSSFEISIQPIIRELCSRYKGTIFCPLLASSLSNCLHKRVLEYQYSLPHPQYLPTPVDPVVFLDTGMSPLRKIIYSASSQYSLRSVIQGVGDLFNLKDLSDDKLVNVSVLVGLFPWDVWSKISSVSRSGSIPSCFVMGVHPVERTVSHYYLGCYHEPNCSHYQTHFNDLTSEDLASLLKRESIGAIQDEMCRALVHQTIDSGHSVDDLEPPKTKDWKEDVALKNLETCVVGLEDDWKNTKRMIAHWFPWIEIETILPRQREKTEEERSLLRDTIHPELRQIVEEFNKCDTKLSRKMKYLFGKQLSVIETEAYL